MLQQFVESRVRVGDLSVTFPDGVERRFGDGTGAPVAVSLTARGVRRLLANPDLGLGEAYMDGDLNFARGDFWDLMTVIGRNAGTTRAPAQWPGRALFRRLERVFEQLNDRAAARRNVHRHYDLSLELYRRFLDRDLQYSCAYFPEPGMSLEAAQAAKKAHIAAKLDLKPGQRVLDIGCGWGGMGLELAGRYGVQVTGVTLSDEQLAVARRRAAEVGLADRARFELKDYRDVEGPFDRIVSVGMLEHVGASHLPEYFRQVARLLTDDGVALIHAIGGKGPPGVTQAFIRRHIFPGGYIPSLSEVTAAAERSDLWITDIEVLRLHYAETLRHWRERFMAQRRAIVELYDERFCRMWEAYLCMSEASFRYLGQMVFQIQLTRKVDTLPITRYYIREREAVIHDLAKAPARGSAAARSGRRRSSRPSRAA